MRKRGSTGPRDPLHTASRFLRKASDLLMTVIVLVLAGNLALAGLFSLVAVAFD
ncbi:hypothetical protein [Methylobacterium brachythecii]|uniref:Uncharacterized protein n=1 Tax=Methylobacterium brachythecii TaxID=1176177 RepID=A0A7W6AGP5_9HYPH|nr:hypothetical protein [Methylobacterium brachythecii]MBB3900691.1 hypothetical protein [Methylobacterium brachythecii]